MNAKGSTPAVPHNSRLLLCFSLGLAAESTVAKQAEAERLRERIQALAVLLGHLKTLCEDLKVRSGRGRLPCKLCIGY